MKKKYLIIGLTIIIVILILDNVRLRIVTNKIKDNLRHKEYLIELKEKSIKEIKQIDSIEIANYENKISPNYESSINRLKRKGLSDPLNMIRDDLMQNQDIIPDRDMPKGKLYFQRNYINIINEKWVAAYYENGHFGGELLLRMDIDKNKKIAWTVLDDNR